MAEASGRPDPTRSLILLWGRRGHVDRSGRRDLSLERIVGAALATADADGSAAVSMRRVAETLGVGTMSLYTYLPGKAELIDLMLDRVYGEIDSPELTAPWRTRLEQVAVSNWELYRRHAWMLDVSKTRPLLGPNALAKYDRELQAMADMGLSELERDAVLNLLTGHAEGAARRAAEAQEVERSSGLTDEQWWQLNAPVLASLVDLEKYPNAAAVGQAVGVDQGTAFDAARTFEFGLQRILDGVEVLVTRRSAAAAGGTTAPVDSAAG